MERNHLKKFQIKYPFSTRNAIWISLVAGIILTGIMSLSHINDGWIMDEDFHIVLTFSLNIALLFLLMVYNFYVIKKDIDNKKKYLYGIIGSIVITILFSLLSLFLHRWIYDRIQLPDTLSVNFLKDLAVAIVAILVSISLFNFTRRHQMTLEKEQLQREVLMARYEALENQLDPHFLFNSLNTLSGLIGNDDEKAQQYLQHLATNYRYIMRGQRIVTLADELQFVSSYCAMMQIRYGDNLIIDNRVDRTLSNYGIIPISIQLLIENALKHNVVSDRHSLTITLETTPQHMFRVSNRMRPKQEMSQGSGLGLANLDKRYRLLCNKRVNIQRVDDCFIVEVPLIEPSEVQKIMNGLSTAEVKSSLL
ncbi:MAG: histidine kinase [Bacteroidales bacterium]|nr:histidine kinase [Bacteroidales bacterium]